MAKRKTTKKARKSSPAKALRKLAKAWKRKPKVDVFCMGRACSATACKVVRGKTRCFTATGETAAKASAAIKKQLKSKSLSGISGRRGLTPQQIKFKAAAAACRGTGDYQACFKRKFR